jgi:hypothetical protein
MNSNLNLQGGMGGDDSLPVSPDPLSPGRTEVDPMREGGIEQLPDNEGQRPLDDDSTGLDPDRVREETGNGEMDREPNPR